MCQDVYQPPYAKEEDVNEMTVELLQCLPLNVPQQIFIW
jgi:hypothetical protein